MTSSNREPERADGRAREETTRYSICTIVTRPSEYSAMVESFRLHGFQEPDCEFLYLDNSECNKFDAYSGYNLFLDVARGSFVILCHQDILLIEDGRTKLDRLIDDLDEIDPNWAACGNGGGEYPGQLAVRISDPYGANQQYGDLPAKVRSLDENFIVVRKSANLALSRDLHGFHFYGADICIIADVLGWNCYVIDFHLRHKSSGTRDKAYFNIRERMIQKYRRAFRSRWLETTTTGFLLSGVPGVSALLSSRVVTRTVRFLGRVLSKVFRG